jgi:hypothetical protein
MAKKIYRLANPFIYEGYEGPDVSIFRAAQFFYNFERSDHQKSLPIYF